MRSNFLSYPKMEEASQDGEKGGGGAATPTVEELMANMATLQAANDKLTKHNETLFSERKADQEKQRLAQEELQKKQLEDSKNANKFEDFEAQLRGQFDGEIGKKDKRIEQLNNMLLGGEKGRLIAEIAGDFLSPQAAKLMLNGLVKTEYGEGESISSSFYGIDGNLVTTDPKAFKEYISSNEAFAPYLKGPDSSGGLSGNGRPSGGAGGGNEMKRADFERLGSHQQMKFIKDGGQIK